MNETRGLDPMSNIMKYFYFQGLALGGQVTIELALRRLSTLVKWALTFFFVTVFLIPDGVGGGFGQ